MGVRTYNTPLDEVVEILQLNHAFPFMTPTNIRLAKCGHPPRAHTAERAHALTITGRRVS